MCSRGLHHITTVIREARRGRHFYANVLGLKIVKKTVCYDDPGSYHLYYGDDVGAPGTVISTLAWRCVPPGMVGVGEVVQTSFRIATGAVDWWAERLTAAAVSCRLDYSPFGEKVLRFADPDGTALALVCAEQNDRDQARHPVGVGEEHAIRGLHGVTLSVREADSTIKILQDVLDFRCVAELGGWMRFVAHDGPGGTLDLQVVGRSSRGRLGGGTIRHVAFRAANADDQAAMVEKLRADHGIAVSEPVARTYLTAVGFRAPCGVLFEIATDGPGFAVDEPLDRLGEELKLPSFLDARRLELQSILPPLDLD